MYQLGSSGAPISLGVYGNAILMSPFGLKAMAGIDVPNARPADALSDALNTAGLLAASLTETGGEVPALSRVLTDAPGAFVSDDQARIHMERLVAVLAGISEERHAAAIEGLLERGGLDGSHMSVKTGQVIAALPEGIKGEKTSAMKSSGRGTPFDQKYSILRQIGEGGEARTYLVQEKATGLLFVARRTKNPEKVEDLRREAGALSSIDHPNVIRVHEWFEEKDARWGGTAEFIIVTDYVARALNFAQSIATGRRFTGDELEGFHNQILAGLSAAHTHGIVHRDIKPSNLLLSEGNEGSRATVIDFGCVRFSGEMTRTTTLGVKGSINWMAPEQMTGGQIGPWTDIHGLALTIAAVATGRMRTDDVIRGEQVSETVKRLRALVAQGVMREGFVRQLETELDPNPEIRMQASRMARSQPAEASTALVPAPESAGEITPYLSALECARLMSDAPVREGRNTAIGLLFAGVSVGAWGYNALLFTDLMKRAFPSGVWGELGTLLILAAALKCAVVSAKHGWEFKKELDQKDREHADDFYFSGNSFRLDHHRLGWLMRKLTNRYQIRVLPVDRMDQITGNFNGGFLLNGVVIKNITHDPVAPCTWHTRIEGIWNGEDIMVNQLNWNAAPPPLQNAKSGDPLRMIVKRGSDGLLYAIDISYPVVAIAKRE